MMLILNDFKCAVASLVATRTALLPPFLILTFFSSGSLWQTLESSYSPVKASPDCFTKSGAGTKWESSLKLNYTPSWQHAMNVQSHKPTQVGFWQAGEKNVCSAGFGSLKDVYTIWKPGVISWKKSPWDKTPQWGVDESRHTTPGWLSARLRCDQHLPEASFATGFFCGFRFR